MQIFPSLILKTLIFLIKMNKEEIFEEKHFSDSPYGKKRPTIKEEIAEYDGLINEED
jgi:hypothetical protein